MPLQAPIHANPSLTVSPGRLLSLSSPARPPGSPPPLLLALLSDAASLFPLTRLPRSSSQLHQRCALSLLHQRCALPLLATSTSAAPSLSWLQATSVCGLKLPELQNLPLAMSFISLGTSVQNPCLRHPVCVSICAFVPAAAAVIVLLYYPT